MCQHAAEPAEDRYDDSMTPLYQDLYFAFRFPDDRIIPRFHLEGIEAGRQISVFKSDPGTGDRLGLLATGTRDKTTGWSTQSKSS